MKNIITFLLILFFMSGTKIVAQEIENCFLKDFEPKTAIIPIFKIADKPTASPTTVVTINVADTIGRISKYIFGNAMAVWCGNELNNPTLIKHLQKLAPTLIRYPGGSWSDLFFWNGIPKDIPDSLLDGNNNGKKAKFYPQSGIGSWTTTVDNYYSIRDQVYTQGLITINYGYARYGLSNDPVAQAAHLAADWVRYDDGRTKFWEVGNENGGPWEAGWQIDTKTNKDGQPEIITGELYGKHFKVIADSMRKAAKELDSEIYIGGQILHYNGESPPSWNVADRKWNEGFFKEAGESADYYVIHNYFGTSAKNARSTLDIATSEIKKNIDFIRSDIIKKNAPNKPIALTEYNMQGTSADWTLAKISHINGMQAVILFNELIKNNFSMSSRWLIATGDDAMFYQGSDPKIPKWNPRPDFYYAYYLQQFTGDKALNTVSNNKDVLAYASTFSSGEMGIVIVNKGTTEQIIKTAVPNMGVGTRYYVYSLKGGTDNGEFSQNVYVNDVGPTKDAWGPLDGLEQIPANAYSIGEEIKVKSPGRSVQYIMVEPGQNTAVEDENNPGMPKQFSLEQNYPNPFNPETVISYHLPENSHVTLKVYDTLGREIAKLVDNYQQAGSHNSTLSALHSSLTTGVYFYKLNAGRFAQTKKMMLLK